MDIRIASPCTESWNRMRGDERVRFCGRCSQNVYNLSAMPKEKAEELLREKEGRVCVRFYQRNDGTVMTRDCPVGLRKRRLARVSWAALAGLLVGAAAWLGVEVGPSRSVLPEWVETLLHRVGAPGVKPTMGEPVFMGKPCLPAPPPAPPREM